MAETKNSSESDVKTAEVTADGKILYEKYHDLVQHVHKKNCDFFSWKYTPLIPGAFGYDNLVYTIYDGLEFLRENKEKLDQDGTEKYDKLAEVIHKAWIKNYIFWRDTKPYETSEKYRKPFNPIGDERRNKCAETPFEKLDTEERQKDIILARILTDLFSQLNGN